MSEDDVLFGYRLRVLDYAARTSVSEACRLFGTHRSTYVWKRRVERHGLEILRPRERRRPRLPTSFPRSSKSGSSPWRSATPASVPDGSRASAEAALGRARRLT